VENDSRNQHLPVQALPPPFGLLLSSRGGGGKGSIGNAKTGSNQNLLHDIQSIKTVQNRSE